MLPVTLQEEGSGLSEWRSRPDDGCLKRLHMMLSSFITMFDQRQVKEFFLVCPPRYVEPLNSFLRSITQDDRYRVLSETALCPEIPEMRHPETGQIEGWYVQQLIKLAICDLVTTPFYLTFDSDILCIKPASYPALLKNGKALLNIETPKDYRRLYTGAFALKEEQVKKKRYLLSAELLGYTRPEVLMSVFYGETPVMMHTESVRALAGYIGERYGIAWRSVLASRLTWTEYSLYFQFLEMTGRLEMIYAKTGCNSVLDLEKSVWHESCCYRRKRRYDRAHFCRNLSRDGEGCFVAVQSWLDERAWLPAGFSGIRDFYDELERWIFFGCRDNGRRSSFWRLPGW